MTVYSKRQQAYSAERDGKADRCGIEQDGEILPMIIGVENVLAESAEHQPRSGKPRAASWQQQHRSQDTEDYALIRGHAEELRGGRSLAPQSYLISTSPTWLTRLLARTGLPSGVTSMLRTMSPPPGI